MTQNMITQLMYWHWKNIWIWNSLTKLNLIWNGQTNVEVVYFNLS